jgi:hypothetical protein
MESYEIRQFIELFRFITFSVYLFAGLYAFTNYGSLVIVLYSSALIIGIGVNIMVIYILSKNEKKINNNVKIM